LLLNVYSTEGRARCHAELQRWSPGCYTLAHDTVETKNTLELLVHFQCEDLPHDAGGFTSFIAKDDDDEVRYQHFILNTVQQKNIISTTFHISLVF
jgi:hypothetical protein